MSHFVVAVVTKEYPTDDVLDKALQPYHEYECTGIVDEYVIHVDKTDDVFADYEKHTTRFLVDPEGNKYSPYLNGNYDPKYLRPATEEEIKNGDIFNRKKDSVDLVSGPLGYNKHVFVLPDGWKDEYLLSKENGVVDIIEFAKDYYSVGTVITEKHPIPKSCYILIDDNGNFLKYFDFTNPNSKWDWYSVGGRYTGRFSDAYDPEKDPRNLEINRFKKNESDPDLVPKWPTQWVKFEGDIIQKAAIDLEKIMNKYRQEQGAKFDGYIKILDKEGYNFKTWEECVDKEQRELFNKQPQIQALYEHENWFDTSTLGMIRNKDRETFVNTIASTYVAPYAFVVNGEWYQKGEMGWFGISVGEKEQMSWNDQFFNMIDNLEPTDWITVVDCHI